MTCHIARVVCGTLACASASIAAAQDLPRAVARADSAPPQAAVGTFLRRNPVSLSGFSGLIFVPTGATTPSGSVDFTFDNTHNSLEIGHDVQQRGLQRNVFLVLGLFPRLTVGARGTLAQDAVHLDVRDLSVNVQLLARREGRVAPALAIGMQDIGQGARPFFQSKFVVATKTLGDRATATVGYGTGPKVLNGLFGGVAVALVPWATVLGDYDGTSTNGSLRLFPFPSLSDRLGVQPRIDLAWTKGREASIGAGFRTRLGGDGEALRGIASPGPDRPVGAAIRPTGPGAAPSEVSAAVAELVALGFENVRVGVSHAETGPTLMVEYENRRFNRDELDALGIVMAVAARHADRSVRRLRVTIRRVDLPVMAVETDLAGFNAFVEERLDAPSFATQLVISSAPERSVFEHAPGGPANVSRWKVDLFVRPRVETNFLTDLGVAEFRVSVLPDAYVQLGRGLVLNARGTIPVNTTKGFDRSLENQNADRLLLHQAMRLPGVDRPDVSALTQFSLGRFGYDAVGIANEMDISVADGRISIGSTLALFGKSPRQLDHSVALGTVRVRDVAWDVTAGLTAGRFRRGDVGGMADLSRMFGSTELAFFFRSTDFASSAGIRVGVPLTPARELKPGRIRPRLPDLHVQELQSTVLDSRPTLRRDVARPLATDQEIQRVFRARDRLQPATVRAHVETLRLAARRWVGYHPPS